MDSDPPAPGSRGLLADMVMALRFFSRLPTGHSAHARPDLNRIAMVLPLAGLVIGIGPAALLWALVAGGFPPLLAALMAAAAFAIVTGAMSEDAAADAADGLFGGNTPERRLEILKDSRHGTYGVLAIVFIIGIKAAALSAIAARDPLAAACLWLAATVLARSGSLYLPLHLAPARASGAAASAGKVCWNGFATGIVLATLAALALAVPFAGFTGIALSLLLALLVVIGWTWICERLVGGQTGDLTGALQALLEIAILAVLMRFVI